MTHQALLFAWLAFVFAVLIVARDRAVLVKVKTRKGKAARLLVMLLAGAYAGCCLFYIAGQTARPAKTAALAKSPRSAK
jgi:hypothetical protein